MSLRETLKSIKPLRNVVRYVIFQIRLAKENLRDRAYRRAHPDAPPIPGARLRHRVHGSLDKESFLRTGAVVADNLRDLCRLAGCELYSFEKILDFGSGSARVLANFQHAPDSCALYGTDIDAALVRWCEGNLPRVRWSRNGYRPPLPFPDGAFDLIYSVSVFTHLDEDFQHAWLQELRRVAKPGALLILTVHGEPVIATLPPALRDSAQAKGFLYVTDATGALKLDKLPDFYQTAYHTREYVLKVWGEYFEVLEHVERGINNHQDAVLLRRF